MLRDNQQFNESIKLNSAFLDELRQKMPEFFTASKYDEEGNEVETATFDNEKFQQALKEHNIDELSSGYRLDFIGKNYAKKQAGERPTTVIVPDNDHNQKEENKNSKNLFFTGDNLEVLRHLQQNYANSVDFIYIDPPYNTGSDGFVYPDNFEYSDDQLKDMFALNEDELKRLKSIQGKATHSAWLTFMYPRLYLAKKVLKDTGVIFVSIDDNEQANLKLLMDEVFGEINFIATLAIENNPKGRKNSDFISVSSEYIIAYARNKNNAYFVENVPKMSSEMKLDENGDYVHGSGKRVLVGENDFNSQVKDFFSKKHYSVYYNIDTNDLLIEKEESVHDVDINLINRGYIRYISYRNEDFVENTYSVEHFKKLYLEKALQFTETKIFEKNFNNKIRLKSIVSNKKYKAIINNKEVEYKLDLKTTSAGQYLENIFQVKKIFTAPKSADLIKLLLTLNSKRDINILDFFAGSSTTADAVMQLNAEDGGKRQYIMCTLPEPTFTVNSDGTEIPTKGGDTAYNAGYKSIDEISRERIRRAANKIKEDNPLLTETQDFGFKHYRVVPPTQETMEKIDYDDQLQFDLFDDMIDAFSSEKLGVAGNSDGFNTILHTYLAKDNYKFDVSLQMIDFAGVQLPYVDNQRIYLIAKNWQAKNTKALVNAIGKNELTVQTIVVYGYTVEMESLRELEIALNQLENKVNLQVRY